jgi:hypothetical protein
MLRVNQLVGFGAVAAAPPSFPVVQATTTHSTAFNTGGTGVANLPAGVVAGDLIIIVVQYANVTLTFPAGWNQLFDGLEGGGISKGGAWYKVAAGGETTVAPTASANTAANTTSYRIDTYVGTPEAATATGVSTTPDPPNLAPSWGTKKTLWIAAATDQVGTLSGTPANYSNLLVPATPRAISAQRNNEVSAENPGTFAHASQGWRSGTIAVQGTG